MRVCLEPGCPALIPKGRSRCPEHDRARDRARGTTTERGYGADHQSLRATYQSRMDAGRHYVCWRCWGLIDPTAYDLGHCDDDRSVTHGPECRACNRATSGRGRCPHPSHRDISPRG